MPINLMGDYLTVEKVANTVLQLDRPADNVFVLTKILQFIYNIE